MKFHICMSTFNRNENVYEYSRKYSYGFTLFSPYYKTPKFSAKYNCIDVNSGLPRSSSWSKILSMIKLYQDDQDEEIYYVFIDETVHINMEVTLEDFMNKSHSISDLVFSITDGKPSSNFIVMKRSNETLEFLKEWYSIPTEHNEGPVAENSTLPQIINNNDTLIITFALPQTPLFCGEPETSDKKIDPELIVSYDTQPMIKPINKVSILVGTPCFGAQVSCNFTRSLLETFAIFRNFDIEHDICFIPNQIVTRARNIIANEFLDTEYTHLFFIDADIHWNPYDALRLLNHQKDVTIGLYANKGYNFDEDNFNMDSLYKSINYSSVFNPEMKVGDISENFLTTVKYGATGFMIINREVFDKIKKNAKSYMDKDKKIIYDYFPCCVVDNEYLTEDYCFCKQWEDIGGDVYADLQLNIRHEGWHSYPGNPLRSMRTE